MSGGEWWGILGLLIGTLFCCAVWGWVRVPCDGMHRWGKVWRHETQRMELRCEACKRWAEL